MFRRIMYKWIFRNFKLTAVSIAMIMWPIISHAETIQSHLNPSLHVPVEIGHESGIFLLDTGAPRSSVASLGAYFAYPIIGNISISGLDGSIVLCDLVKTPAWRFSKLPAKATVNDVSRCAPGSNILGLNAIKNHILELDMASRRVTISDKLPPHFPANSAQVMHWTHGGHLVLPIGLSGPLPEESAIGAIFDTGDMVTIADAKFVELHPETFTPINANVDVYNSFDEKHKLAFYHADKIVVAGLNLSDVDVLAADLSYNADNDSYEGERTIMILGLDIISKMNWVMDLRDKSVARFSAEPIR